MKKGNKLNIRGIKLNTIMEIKLKQSEKNFQTIYNLICEKKFELEDCSQFLFFTNSNFKNKSIFIDNLPSGSIMKPYKRLYNDEAIYFVILENMALVELALFDSLKSIKTNDYKSIIREYLRVEYNIDVNYVFKMEYILMDDRLKIYN